MPTTDSQPDRFAACVAALVADGIAGKPAPTTPLPQSELVVRASA